MISLNMNREVINFPEGFASMVWLATFYFGAKRMGGESGEGVGSDMMKGGLRWERVLVLVWGGCAGGCL